MRSSFSYVLVTPARNEAAFIEQTIRSVAQQTILPLKWIIVDDGSTDGTGEIIAKWAREHAWLERIATPPREERHFAGKARALMAAYEQLRSVPHDAVGSLDADISFDDPELFGFLLSKFMENPRLGIAGVPFREGNVQYDYRFSRREHVSGACQLFRRDCFEAIGGYVPLEMGAIDLVANVTARMKGWQTETFPEKFCVHHRVMGTAKDHIVRAHFKSGVGDYRVGVHPLWQMARSIYQMSRRPFFIGGFLLLTGYLWAFLTRMPKAVSREFVHFRHREQAGWLKDYFTRWFLSTT